MINVIVFIIGILFITITFFVLIAIPQFTEFKYRRASKRSKENIPAQNQIEETEFYAEYKNNFSNIGVPKITKELENAAKASIGFVKERLLDSAKEGETVCYISADKLVINQNLANWLKDNNFLYIDMQRYLLIYPNTADTKNLTLLQIRDLFLYEKKIKDLNNKTIDPN
jgi:hypothetical protein